MVKKSTVLTVSMAVLCMTVVALSEAILTPGDPIIAIDETGVVSNSSYPSAENPANVLDNDPNTKYLNNGGSGSGFIVTLAEPTLVQSFTLTTANDAADRDPADWELWGTNDEITSTDNSTGMEENWVLIDANTVELPEDRLTVSAPINVAYTGESYSSFKLVFPNTSGGSLMQIADAAFYLLTDAIGDNLLSSEDAIIAVHEGQDSSYPSGENPSLCIDDDADTKYLNFGEEFSGFIVTPTIGASVLDSFDIITANDAVERDPVVWMVYGTNDEIVTADNGSGLDENWTLICGGTMALPEERYTLGSVYTIANQAEAYTSYKMVFESVKDADSANSMQIAEVQFYGELAAVEDDVETDVEDDSELDG